MTLIVPPKPSPGSWRNVSPSVRQRASITRSPRRTGWNVVPIENIYYLLCYAWDALDEGEALDVSPAQSRTIIDLFARVLIRGTRDLITHGLDLDYRAHRAAIMGLRGKLDVSATITGLTWTRGQTICRISDRSADVPQNQILKATLKRLTTLPTLAPTLATSAAELVTALHAIRDVPLTSTLVRSARVHRNNRVYDLLLNICRLIASNPFLETTPGHATFPDFIGDRADMARLFEEFIYNFYTREQHHFAVRRPIIAWHATEPTSDVGMLPIMRTDVMLTAPTRRIVIDTKYYEHAFQAYRGSTKIRSPHLYQILAYLQNIAAADPPNASPLEGILLYPRVDVHFHQEFTILGHRVTVQSIDLNQPWQAIHTDLLTLLKHSFD